jgi:hypothetical protein
MKLCINCKHYVLNKQAPTMPHLGLCAIAPSPQNPVDGSTDNGHPYRYCSTERISGCNLSAKHYEEKESNHV